MILRRAGVLLLFLRVAASRPAAVERLKLNVLARAGRPTE
jgi:hypothetical protein